MSAFTESALLKKLADLNSSQQSIQTLSLWLIHHRKHHATIVKTWARELQTGNEKKMLTFMYLANDVIQNSKKKGPEYGREFAIILGGIFRYIKKHCKSEKLIASLGRILNIWEERGVYDPKLIIEYRGALLGKTESGSSASIAAHHMATNGNSKAEKSERREKRKQHDERSGSGSGSSSGKTKKSRSHQSDESGESSPTDNDQSLSPLVTLSEPPESEALIEALASIENSASSDALVRQRIASLSPEFSMPETVKKLKNKEEAIQLSNKIDEALELINNYNARLASEMEDRTKLAAMLIAYHNEQKELLAQAEQRQIDNRKKLSTYTALLKEVRNHLANLPDLSRLPDVTGRLAPLPSAGDLFNKC